MNTFNHERLATEGLNSPPPQGTAAALAPSRAGDSTIRARSASPAIRLGLVGVLFLLALLARLIGLGEAVTEDEDQWMLRAGGFAKALDLGVWRNTFQVGHPGVTTMWLTTLTLPRSTVRSFAGQEHPDRQVTQVSGFVPALQRARLPFAVMNALLATLCGLLAYRLFGLGPGLVAGLLLALEPYWLAMSPIVGMDGLLAGLVSASLLAMLVALAPGGRRQAAGGGRAAPREPGKGQGATSDSCAPQTTAACRLTSAAPWWALGSGLLAGLALLTKGPALFLLLVAPLLTFESIWQAPRRRAAARQVAGRLALWGVGLAAAAAIWPAMWVDPIGTVGQTAEFVLDIGTTPHQPGNYFLGQPVVDPGALFYPVALALRLGPGTSIGLLGLALFQAAGGWRQAAADQRAGGRGLPLPAGEGQGEGCLSEGRLPGGQPSPPPLPGGEELSPSSAIPAHPFGGLRAGSEPAEGLPPAAGFLLVFVLLFWLGLTASPKKVDRYVLPLLPALDVLAALGWWGALGWLARRRSSPAIRPVGFALIGLLQLWPLVGAAPHPLSAYNPLFGGMRSAEQALPVGWGEGLDYVGAYLTEQPNADQLVTAIWYPLWINFQAEVPGPVVSIGFSGPGQVATRQLYEQADFYVDYIHARQRRLTPSTLQEVEPDFVVRLNGAEYARVYRLKPPQPAGAG